MLFTNPTWYVPTNFTQEWSCTDHFWTPCILEADCIWDLLTKVEAGEGVGALPLWLLVVGSLELLQHQRHPPAEHKHAWTQQGGRVEGARQGVDSPHGWTLPIHGVWGIENNVFTLKFILFYGENAPVPSFYILAFLINIMQSRINYS